MNKDTAYILTHINIFHSINPIDIRRYISHFDIYYEISTTFALQTLTKQPPYHTQLPTIVLRQGM